MSTSRALGVVTVMLAAAAIAGCGSSSSTGSGKDGSTNSASSSASSGSGKPLTILYVGDQSGATKVTSDQQLAGLKAGIKYYNGHGGIDGRQLQLAEVDDNASPATAVSGTIRYLSSHPAPGMTFAGTESDVVAAMIPFVSKRSLLSISVNDGNLQCAKNASTTCSTFFSLGNPPSVTTQAAANWFKSKGFKKVGILQEDLAFTQSETPSITSSLKKYGIQTQVVSFPPTAVDLTPQLSQLKSGGVQAIYAEAYEAQAGYVLTDGTKQELNLPVLFDLAGSASNLSRLASPADLKNSYIMVASPSDARLTIPGVKTMLANGGPPMGTQSLYLAAFGWDAVVAYHDAVAQAKSTDATAVAKAMENLSPSAQNDPLYANSKRVYWTKDVHQNLGFAASDYHVLPNGPFVNGQVGGKK